MEKIDQSLNKHEEQNRLTDVSIAVAIRKKVDEYAQVEAANLRQFINSFDVLKSKETTSDVTDNELPIILPRVSENLSHSLK